MRRRLEFGLGGVKSEGCIFEGFYTTQGKADPSCARLQHGLSA